jgi:Protein of unknown function (DUF3040)
MSAAGDRDGLDAIERELADDDPTLAEAFQRWRVPAAGRERRPAGTTVPPWMLAVFLTAGASWVASPGFGVLAGALATAWVLLGGTDARRGRPGGARAADGPAEKPPRDTDGPDDGRPFPCTWRGGWV